MRYPQNLLDEIRARLSVSDVVGRKVALKKKGREYAGLSPFKSEKSASFFVNDQKGFYHCFASGEHGDIFTFLIKTEGLSFPEAVERLAQEAGVELPKQQRADPERHDERTRILELLECAAKFFETQLKTSLARSARTYLERRQLHPSTIATFRLGYAPASRNALRGYLEQQGFAVAELVRSGMLIGGDDIPTPYDRFRDRIMFPIADARGRIVAFGGRALDPAQPAKYLNSPETPVFHKGHLLYNAHRARPAAHDTGSLIVVEGYMDAIALAQAGFHHAVAPLGTALTAEQIQLLWRMCPEPTLCFDGDAAGRRAAHRAIDTVLPHIKPGFSLHFAFLPDGADPDDIVRDQGAGAFEQVLTRRQSLSDTLWEREWEQGEWTTPERRAKLEHDLRKLILGINDPAVRGHYGHIIAEKLRGAWHANARQPTAKGPYQPSDRAAYGQNRSGQNSHGREPKWRTGARPGSKMRGNFNTQRFDSQGHSSSLKSSSLVTRTDTVHDAREALLLRVLINNPWFIGEVAEELALLEFRNNSFRTLRDALLSACADEKDLDTVTLRDHLNSSGYAPNLEKTDRMATNRCDAFAEPDADRVAVENGWRHTLSLHMQQQSLRAQLVDAEREYRLNEDEDALTRILDLQRMIATIVPNEAVLE